MQELPTFTFIRVSWFQILLKGIIFTYNILFSKQSNIHQNAWTHHKEITEVIFTGAVAPPTNQWHNIRVILIITRKLIGRVLQGLKQADT